MGEGTTAHVPEFIIAAYNKRDTDKSTRDASKRREILNINNFYEYMYTPRDSSIKYLLFRKIYWLRERKGEGTVLERGIYKYHLNIFCVRDERHLSFLFSENDGINNRLCLRRRRRCLS